MKTVRTILSALLIMLLFTFISCQKEEIVPEPVKTELTIRIVEGTFDITTITDSTITSPVFKITGGDNASEFNINSNGKLSSNDTLINPYPYFYKVEVTITDSLNKIYNIKDINICVVSAELNSIFDSEKSPFLKSTSVSYGNGVTDNEGNYYNTMIINGQEWMIDNLKVTHYNNGDTIPTTNWIYYGATYHSDSTYKNYGVMYSFNAASGDIAPAGWRVATKSDWHDLAMFSNSSGISFNSFSCPTNHWWTSTFVGTNGDNNAESAYIHPNGEIIHFGTPIEDGFIKHFVLCVKN